MSTQLLGRQAGMVAILPKLWHTLWRLISIDKRKYGGVLGLVTCIVAVACQRTVVLVLLCHRSSKALVRSFYSVKFPTKLTLKQVRLEITRARCAQ